MTDAFFHWSNCTTCFIQADRSAILDLHHKFSFEVPGARFQPAVKSGRWDGYIRLVGKDGSCPVGLVPQVIGMLSDDGYKVRMSQEFQEYRKMLPFETTDFVLPEKFYEKNPVGFQEHQVKAVSAVLEKKRCVVLSPTSSGKSLNYYTLSRIMLDAGERVLIIVPSIMLVNQMLADWKEYMERDRDFSDEVCLSTKEDIVKSQKRIVISTWQTLQNIQSRSFFESFGFVGVDEVHEAKAKEITAAINKCVNAFYRVGMTGSLDNTLTTEMALIALFGPVIRVAKTKELQDAGLIANVKIRGLVLKYSPSVCKPLGKLPYADEVDWLINYRPRNRLICNIANSCEGNTIVMLSLIEDHGKPLKEMMDEICVGKKVFLIDADTKDTKRDEIKQMMERETGIIVIATYKLFSTGISIKNLHNLIFASPMKSVTKIIQSIGRVLRLHESKQYGTIIDIGDDLRGTRKKANYTLLHFFERLGIYQKEEFVYTIIEKEI